MTDVYHGGGILGGQGKGGLDIARALDKQFHGAIARELVDRGRVFGVRRPQRQHGKLPLTAHM